MNNNGNPTSIARNITTTIEEILYHCEKLKTKEEKISYLKKVINDCQRIINLAETIDGKVLDLDLLKKAEQNIDENLIMFLEGLCKPPVSKPAGKQGKVPMVVKQPRKYYIVSPTDGGRVCDIQSAIYDMKKVMECLEDKKMVVEAVDKIEETAAVNTGDIIKIETGISVIVRIFECMKEVRIIWSETPIKDIIGIFFSDALSKIKYEKNYNAAKNRIEKEESSTSNTKLLNFILLLIEKSFKGKEKELEIIIRRTEELQKNII